MGNRTPKEQEKLRRKRRAVSAENLGKKRVVSSNPDVSAYDKFFRFRFDRVDLGSDWCLTAITKEEHRSLITAMAEIEAMKVSELIPHRCKREDVAASSPNPDAQRRARQQFPDDHDHIHSLRISGARRLWGLLYDNEFSVIWWDSGHEVWPTKRVYEN